MALSLFYSHFQADPYFNMAFDEWLLGRVDADPAAAFLRLYTWQIGTITIGFNQREATALNFSKIGSTPVIRRITGGRALYHDPDELTYSVAVNMSGPAIGRLSGSISQTSMVIADALTRFLAALGVQAAYQRQSSAENAIPAFFHKAPCFASVAKYEVVADGAKIVASAQKRVGSALLQHGSIKLHGIVQHPALNMDAPHATDAAVRMTQARFTELANQFRVAMSDGLGISFQVMSGRENEAAVSKLADAIKKNPLDKRDSVKQRFGASSL